jgi:hypothetical protein
MNQEDEKLPDEHRKEPSHDCISDDIFRDLIPEVQDLIRKRYDHIKKQVDLACLVSNDLTQKLQKALQHIYYKEFKVLALSVYNAELGIANYKDLK